MVDMVARKWKVGECDMDKVIHGTRYEARERCVMFHTNNELLEVSSSERSQ